MRRRGLEIEYKADDGTPVTNADLAADALLTERLRAARPDYGWLSEETADDPDRLTRQRLFVVDPIDGTRAFLKDRPWWAVSIAVVEDGRPIAGVVFAPRARTRPTPRPAGGGATLNGAADPAQRRRGLEGCAHGRRPAAVHHCRTGPSPGRPCGSSSATPPPTACAWSPRAPSTPPSP